MAMEKRDDNFVFEIKAHLGVIATKREGWKRELNLVSWNGQDPAKFDIRDWSDDHTKMSRGITMYDSEMHKVMQLYNQFCNARVVSESRNSKNAAARAGMRAGEEASEVSQKGQSYEETGSGETEAAAGSGEADALERDVKAAHDYAEAAAANSDVPEMPAGAMQGDDIAATEEQMPF